MLSNYLQGSCTKYNIVWAEGGGGDSCYCGQSHTQH
jgi:hypothetical protein